MIPRKLAAPPPNYTVAYERQRNQVIDDLRTNAYTGQSDLVLRPGLGIILFSPNGSAYRVTVTDAGALQVDAYPL